MAKLLSFQVLLILLFSCTAIKNANIAESELIRINGDTIVADEFLYVYEKNNFNNDNIYSKNDVDEYFDLFINFKLKVAEAKAGGLDTTKAFIQEYETYKNQLIKPYLSEAKERERLVREAYERMKYEIDASHILVSLRPDASPEDTIAAYQKMLEVYEKAISGQDFGELAFAYSEDPSVKSNKGRLGYFTVFQMVFQFEDAAYGTPVDSISDILRSGFGYHIMKVHDKRPYSGKVKVSHIMLGHPKNSGDESTLRNKIFEIHEQIVGGADWNELCLQYSEDQRTKSNGGALPFIGLRQINDTAFENAAFDLQYPGEISDPVRSKFGWHIIKLDEKKGLEPFEDIKEDLEQRISRDDRSKLSRQAVIAKLKASHSFKESISARARLVQLADSSLLRGAWTFTKNEINGNDTLFVIGNRPYKTIKIAEAVVNQQKSKIGISPQQYMNELIDSEVERGLLAFEEQQLLKNNREFRLLLKEYYEGILLFEIMNRNVWGKAVEDTVGLQTFFNKNQDSYYWGKRAEACILKTGDRLDLAKIKDQMHESSYELFEFEIDAGHNVDILKNNLLDSLVALFEKYDRSTVHLVSSDISSGSETQTKIKNHLRNIGIPDESVIYESNDSIGNKIRLKLNSKSKKSLEYLYNKESALNLQVAEGLFEKGDLELLDTLSWEKGYLEFENKGDNYLVIINEILEEQPKKLKDVKGLVISDYQNYLEKNWLTELKNKYTVETNELTLDKIKRAYRKKLYTPD
ncbi:MAG: peptidylprolyl isomerase [Cytophagales bacterium]|nr:peptidylprolyl isomerase [Cytophagales bacterium]